MSRMLTPSTTPAGDFTDCGMWTPQTFMLRSIRAWIERCEDEPCCALSIDCNPTLDRILLERWPELRIERALHPEQDVQALVGVADESFDLAYSHQVLEHVPKPWLAGRELVRVLKPGGLGLHTSCAYNPLHGPPAFGDYYRFMPDGLAQLFEGADVLVKGGWGNRAAIAHNVTVDDGHGALGGRRFGREIGETNDSVYPWATWVIVRNRHARSSAP
jgi:SAM-dependent methyltransferase